MRTRASSTAVLRVFGGCSKSSPPPSVLSPRGEQTARVRGNRPARQKRPGYSETRVARVVVAFVIAGLVLVPTALAEDCPELVGRWPYGAANGVAVSGTFAYFGSGTVLIVADVSNAAKPQVVAEVVLPGVVSDVAISGSYAYVAEWTGLRVIDISTPASATEVGFVALSGGYFWGFRVAVSGSYAYVLGAEAGLRVIDISTPTSPDEVGFVVTPGPA